jgi:hypothetical protein
MRILSNLTKPNVRKPALFVTINNVMFISSDEGQISQTGNMTSTQGISRVLVTGDISVGLSTMITEVTVSLIFIVVPCILIILKLFSPTNAHLIEHIKC